ncbi:MAG: hypothetical protein IPM21_01770 [Acidobacteria bacterium]|nr:hypothetical protein [Acidobacteriota bacterium]
MKTKILPFAALLFLCPGAFGQKPAEPEERKVKVVVTENIKAEERPASGPNAGERPRTVAPVQPVATPETPPSSAYPNTGRRTPSFNEIKAKIADAKRRLQSRPITTASRGNAFEGVEAVRVAFFDWDRNDIDFVMLAKDAFLSTASDKAVVSEGGRNMILRTIRGNGVNTPVIIFDERNQQHLPLLVQYPRVDKGVYQETAYYMSTHPGIVTPEVVGAGQIYVRNVINTARERLGRLGFRVDPKVADIAERLAVVEHVDHLRFRTEPHQNIYNDVFTLFALNEGQTYRYAVSSAGAGGMVQMIPSTYRMVRAQFPNVPLNPNFVEGMRDHVNASQAMLLYMQWTWDDLKSRPSVSDALLRGLATQEQIMAAGYNSNPARLPGYITRGGAGWANLIPRETKIYLQIFASVEQNVPMTPRRK